MSNASFKRRMAELKALRANQSHVDPRPETFQRSAVVVIGKARKARAFVATRTIAQANHAEVALVSGFDLQPHYNWTGPRLGKAW